MPRALHFATHKVNFFLQLFLPNKQEIFMAEFRLSSLPKIMVMLAAGGLGMAAWGAAAAPGPFYRAELAAPAPQARFVTRDIVWICDGANCTAGRGSSRPQIMCATLVKTAGPVTSFVAGGTALDEAELAKCNGKD
jgi:hypothetical protein